MPRRIFKKFALKRHQLSEKWFLAPFRHLLHDRQLWGIRRRSVVPAFAVGLFVAFLPFPAHYLQAALIALVLRVNIPIAAVTTFLSNPLTMGPIYWFSFEVGRRLLSIPPTPFEIELSLHWVAGRFLEIWQPLLLGCFMVGATVAIVGYILLDIAWRYSLADYKSRKRKERHR